MAVAFVVATPTTKVLKPAVAALVMACTASVRAVVESLVVPAHDGSPSVASRMNFSVRIGQRLQVFSPRT